MNKKRISALALALGMAIGSSAAMAAPESMIDFSNLAFNDDTSPIEFSLYLDYDWYSVDTWGKDEVSQYITETTGAFLSTPTSPPTVPNWACCWPPTICPNVTCTDRIRRNASRIRTYAIPGTS